MDLEIVSLFPKVTEEAHELNVSTRHVTGFCLECAELYVALHLLARLLWEREACNG